EQRLNAAYAGHQPGDAPTARAVGGASGADPDETLPLARMEELDDYRVSSDDPRGWDVVTAEGEKVGDVKEMLVDTATMRARYLVCDLDEKRLELERLDRHVLMPVARVQLNPDKKRVLANALFKGDLATYPVYAGLPLTGQQADAIERAFPTPPPQESPAAATQGAGRHFFGRRMGEEPGRREAEPEDVRADARADTRLDERTPPAQRGPEQMARAASPPQRQSGVASEEELAEEERSRLLTRESNAAERELGRGTDGGDIQRGPRD
ncbi:MAG TPA: PRC-barrel domain-containing protein, partial [Longimicrobiales bacterium]|nr:PRC-barrel domain-containing protein [Longimicrobiales bacterium]